MNELLLLLAALLAAVIGVPLAIPMIRARAIRSRDRRETARVLHGKIRAALTVLGVEVYQLGTYAQIDPEARDLYVPASQTYIRAVSLMEEQALSLKALTALDSDVAQAMDQMRKVRAMTGLGPGLGS